MIVISDTSVVTSLIQIDRLSLLQTLYGPILIPEAVHRELCRSHESLPGFLEVRQVLNREMVTRLKVVLDLGEAEAIVLAKETQADLLLIDEKLGRQVAACEGVTIAGLMGVLVEAKHQGLIGSVREFVGLLEDRAGFRISAAVKKDAFLAAGE